MTLSESMTLRELLELAALDALGLLDEFEAALYTRSLLDAPATVQDEIKRLQAEVASDERLLPGEEPDPALRERVLKAVADAIEHDDNRLAPLATIGRRRGREARDRIHHRLRASGQFWRAACFVLAGIAVVFALFWVQTQRYVVTLTEIAKTRLVEKDFDLMGPTAHEILMDPSTGHKVLTLTEAGTNGAGLFLFNERTRCAVLITDGLPQGGSSAYTVSVRTGAGGEFKELKRFGSTGGLQGFDLGQVAVASLATVTITVTDSVGTVILTSA
jgi:hypothetical protein